MTGDVLEHTLENMCLLRRMFHTGAGLVRGLVLLITLYSLGIEPQASLETVSQKDAAQ